MLISRRNFQLKVEIANSVELCGNYEYVTYVLFWNVIVSSVLVLKWNDSVFIVNKNKRTTMHCGLNSQICNVLHM